VTDDAKTLRRQALLDEMMMISPAIAMVAVTAYLHAAWWSILKS
jgi:hypothetical protein